MAYRGITTNFWPIFWSYGNHSEYKTSRLLDINVQDRWWLQILLAHYPDGTCVPPHTDALKNRDVYRMVLVLRHTGSGGDVVGPKIFKLGRRLYLLRPDLYKHELTPVVGGERISLLITFYVRQTVQPEIQ